MNTNLKIANPLTSPEWDKQVLNNQEYSFFHSTAWARVLSESYGYIPKYAVQLTNNNFEVLVPLMEISSSLFGRRGVSLPFTDYCDPIIKEDIPFEDIFNHLIEYGKNSKWKHIELRSGKTIIPDENKSKYFYGHTLTLYQDEDNIYSGFSNSTKRNIKKATREGVKVNISNSLDSMKKYYHLHCLTRKRHGLPPQPFYFFEKILDHIISKDLGFIALADVENITIAGAVYFHFGEKALYKYGASDIRYQNLRPNNLVMWEAIKWYIRNNYTHFCFGRTDFDHEGLRRFKSGWGSTEKIYNYFKYDLSKDTYKKEDHSTSLGSSYIFRKMPIPLSRAIGSVMYKHVG